MVAPERLLLIGFMGAGKTSVGESVARALDWRFLDVDTEIVSREGRSIASIFETDGESVFRRIEREVAGESLTASGVVVASGGGWAARPGWIDEVPEGTLSVWLDVGVDEAIRRAGDEARVRPLLRDGTRPQEVAELLKSRLPYYALADERVDTEGWTVEDVTARVLEFLARDTDPTRTE